MSDADYNEWIGRLAQRYDTATAAPIRLMAATLNRDVVAGHDETIATIANARVR